MLPSPFARFGMTHLQHAVSGSLTPGRGVEKSIKGSPRDQHTVPDFDGRNLTARCPGVGQIPAYPEYLRLGRWDDARKHAERWLDMNAVYVRGRMFNTALLATTFVTTDQDKAIQVGTSAVDLAAGLQSRHSREYVADLQQRLGARGRDLAVGDFNDYVVEVLGT